MLLPCMFHGNEYHFANLFLEVISAKSIGFNLGLVEKPGGQVLVDG